MCKLCANYVQTFHICVMRGLGPSLVLLFRDYRYIVTKVAVLRSILFDILYNTKNYSFKQDILMNDTN